MDSNGMKGWGGTWWCSQSSQLKGGTGMEIQGGNMLPCQPSNFFNRRKLVMNNCWVGILRENYALWKNERLHFWSSTFAIPPLKSCAGNLSVGASCRPAPDPAVPICWPGKRSPAVQRWVPAPSQQPQADPSPAWIIPQAAVKARWGFHKSVFPSNCFESSL